MFSLRYSFLPNVEFFILSSITTSVLNFETSFCHVVFFCRLIADNRIGKIVSQCCDIQQGKRTSIEQMKADQETLMRAAPPEWACWKTGIELSCFGAKLLRVCQLGSNEPYYGGKSK